MNNDRLKFKAWDKTHKEWYMNGDCFDLQFSGRYGDFYFDNDNPSNMRDVKLEWVQCTSRKDKHGKLIFDGSILKWDDGIQDPETYIVSYGKGTYDSGFYSYTGFICTDEKGDADGNGHILEKAEEIEIIGSIQATPELLKS